MISNTHTGSLGSAVRNRTRVLLKSLSRSLGFADQQVYYGLVIAYGLLFVFPSLGFINFAYKYDFFTDRQIAYYFLAILVLSYLGFFILRTHADRIRNISKNLEQSISSSQEDSSSKQTNELNRIVTSFQELVTRMEKNNQALESRAGQLRSLGELTDPNSTSLSANFLLKLGLQKACEGVGAGRGWVLMLDHSRRHHFTVECEIDSNGSSFQREGIQVPFNEIKAKHAVNGQRPIFLSESIWQGELPDLDDQTTQAQGTTMVVPLVMGRDVFGVMCLESNKESSSFSSTELEYILPLTSCLCYRYENLLLQKRLTSQTDKLNCLSAFNRICSKGLVQGKVFQLLVTELRNYLDLKVSFLALSDAGHEYLKLLEVASEEPIFLHRGMTLPLRQSLFKQVLEENRQIHQKAVIDKVGPLEAKWFRQLGINSCYLAPFRIQGVNAGILFAGSDSGDGFSNSQQVILQQACEYLGLVIHNQMLLQQIDEQGRELEALNRMGNVVTSAMFDLDEVLDQVGMLIDQMIAVEAGAIYLRERDGLAVKKSFGTKTNRLESSKVKSIEGICGYVISRGESVLVRDASQNPHLSSLDRSFSGSKARSILCVPMVVGEEVVGAIHMWNKERGSFTAHDKKVIKAVAASLATIVASSRLQQLCERLTAMEV